VKWITREQVRVGRMGCAWLIKRFIDTDAEFLFAPGADVMADAERLGATPYHVAGSELNNHDQTSSFEAVLEHYQLGSDPALALLGKIVGTADVKSSPWQQPEGPGLKAVTEGIHAAYADDPARIQAGFALYDAFYAYCQDMVRRGLPDGLFKK
jgi:hypothetical protein